MVLRRPTAKYKVRTMLPKQVAVNGNLSCEIKWRTYAMGPIITAQELRKSADAIDHRMANLRGRRLRIGNSVKHMTKQATAAKLRPPKMRMRSHRLSANQPSSSSRRDRAGMGAPGASPSVVGSRTLPSPPNGLYFCSEPSKGFCLFVFAGCSLRDQPKLFMLSLKDDDAMSNAAGALEGGVWGWEGAMGVLRSSSKEDKKG